MALFMQNLTLGLDQPLEALFLQVQKKLRVSADDIKQIELYKKSLDARKRHNVHFVATVKVTLHIDEQKVCAAYRGNNLQYREETTLIVPTVSTDTRPIVIGFGPAGLFCAYMLASAGCRPIVLERGSAIPDRVAAIEGFWQHRTLNESCNVQFGEGGAGTFSDGKLTTRISDPRCEAVLSAFVQFGAPSEILSKAKPHIGTDRLRDVIVSMRKEIEGLGGTVLFDHQVQKLSTSNGRISGVVANGIAFAANHVVLAIGHSARDTFSMLLDQGLTLQPKSFSVGVRVEHTQQQINEGLYGNLAGHPNLPVGEYQLSHRVNGRGVYTFCMCPGGVVVPSSSSADTVVVNGMSEYARDGKNANAAVVVSVDPADYGQHPLDGMRFQERLERAAFVAGGSDYTAPAVTMGHFLKGETKLSLGAVTPSYSLGVTAADFDQILPPFVTDLMRTGLQVFDRRLKGFATGDAVLTGVETRTSSPVRIVRDDNLCASDLAGLYPCGEGAGYAGGIMSAAVDGIRVAEQILKTLL